MSAETTDFPTKKEDLYGAIIQDDAFLNELWHTLGATDKASMLGNAGFNLYKEWQEYQQESQINDR